jgi:transcriptional regulator with PAS, ATPase and Fis domain
MKKHEQKKHLVTFAGNRDPLWETEDGVLKGPVLMTVNEGGFSDVTLLSSSVKHDLICSEIKDHINKGNAKISVNIVKCHLKNPVDYREIYPVFEKIIPGLLLNGYSESMFCISSGTPQMSTVIILLHAQNLLNNTSLIKAVEPRFNNNKFAIERVWHPFEPDMPLFNALKIEKKDEALCRLMHCQSLIASYETMIQSKGFSLEMDPLKGESQSLLQAKTKALKIAEYDQSRVLITGETGTGKELMAWLIHNASPRADKPFIEINCAALPENLAESELFGHVKGSFTSACSDRKGAFQAAREGTLFLDEIGELPLTVQAKLLKVIETGRFTKIGDNKPIKSNARIVAATNRDLKKEVVNNTFRKDLYYRLAVCKIEMPSLKTRKQDIQILADYFLMGLNKKYCKNKKFTSRAYDKLINHEYPGNVRELKNIIESAFVTSDSSIDNKHIQVELDIFSKKSDFCINFTGQEIDLDSEIRNLENQIYTNALKITGNNKSEAARLLGIPPHTLRKRLKKFNI